MSETSISPDINFGSKESRSDVSLWFSCKFWLTRSYMGVTDVQNAFITSSGAIGTLNFSVVDGVVRCRLFVDPVVWAYIQSEKDWLSMIENRKSLWALLLVSNTMNSVEQMAWSVKHMGRHIRLVSGFSFEARTELSVRTYLLLFTLSEGSKTGKCCSS